MGILVINCGSSSVKFAHFDDFEAAPLVQGVVECIGEPGVSGHYKRRDGGKCEIPVKPESGHAKALAATFKAIDKDPELEDMTVDAVGHRVVHGGTLFSEPIVVGHEELADIRSLAPLAPVHAGANARGIEAAEAVLPGVPQVAVFDTGFHQTIEPHIHRYAIPEEYYRDHQVRRYGFHGTSHEYVAGEACKRLGLDRENSRLITAHLGNGCSATAILNGKSVDTSMGLTPLEGLVMGTRSGSVDPNLHAYIVRSTGMSLDDVTCLLNKKSGLLGVSGISNDLRTLSERVEAGCKASKLAIDIFSFRIAREIAALGTALGGRPDAIVFTGGIGENSSLVRALVLEQLGVLGVELAASANSDHGGESGIISRPESDGPTAIVVATNEELAIAEAAQAVIQRSLTPTS